MEFKLQKPADYKTVPWKNGRGLTKELAVHFGDDKERYVWRISIAGVTEDGPFSDFRGYERTLIMLEGNGIELSHSDGTESKLIDINGIARFSGDLITNGKLTDGQIKDFNVITLREKCTADTRIIKEGVLYRTEGDGICVYAVTGSEFVFDGRTFSVPEDHLMTCYGKISTDIKVKQGRMIAVTFRYLTGC